MSALLQAAVDSGKSKPSGQDLQKAMAKKVRTCTCIGCVHRMRAGAHAAAPCAPMRGVLKSEPALSI